MGGPAVPDFEGHGGITTMHVIDANLINETAELANCESLLQCIAAPPDAAGRGLETRYFPPLRRPLQDVRDWWMIRGMTPSSWTYQILYAIARRTRPWLVAEIGVGWGYGLMAMAKGARDAGYTDITVNGYDDEVTPGCLEWARECLMAERIGYNLSHSTSAQYTASGLPLSGIDLFHLDADYSGAALRHDALLAAKTLSGKGVIVITGYLPRTAATVATALHALREEWSLGGSLQFRDALLVCRPSQMEFR